MKYKLFAYAALPVISIAFLGAGAASAQAHGGFGGWGMMGWGMMGSNLSVDEIVSRQSAGFEQAAKVFGVSVDELKAGWAEGKSPLEVAREKGITDEQIQTHMKEARTAQLKTQLSALVSKGIITQAQADKRLQTMQTQAQKGPGRMKGRGMMHGGFDW